MNRQYPELTERQRQVLAAIVVTYINSAEEVGSRTVAKQLKSAISSATIRNEMSDLEEYGLIMQPHTSAGRVPTDLGYRYFVDMLMEPEELPTAERRCIDNEYHSKRYNAEEIIRKTSRLLSLVTRHTALVELPSVKTDRLKHVELVWLSLSRVIVILVDTMGNIHSQIVYPEDELSMDAIVKINNYLRECFSRRSYLSLDELERLLTRREHERQVLARSTLEFLHQVTPPEQSREHQYVIEGTHNLLEKPEFKSSEQTRRLIELLEAPNGLNRLFAKRTAGDDSVEITIGEENQMSEVQQCSIIKAYYRSDNESGGYIGIIGPTRMPYSLLTSLVSYTSHILGRFLSMLDKE